VDPRNAFYEYARPILESAVRWAAARSGFDSADDVEELRREADLVYCEAQQYHQPGRALFEHHLKFMLNHRLANVARDRARRHRILKQVPADMERMPAADLGHWSDGLSEESSWLVRLAAATKRGLDPRQASRRIKDYLRDLGWSAGQIAKCWKEIAEALSEP
jgi:hypothetical protein